MKPELQKNILKFGYGVNYKDEGMLAHSFDRFYVVTKFILPKMDDLKLSLINYNKNCKYLNDLDDNDNEQIKTNIKDLITLSSAYNEKKYAEILLRYRQLFIKGDVFISERGVFGAEVFLRYRQFFVKSDFVIGRVECTCCIKLRPYMAFYEMHINPYNKTAHHMLKNEVDLILPKFLEGRKSKRGIFGTIILGFVGLAFEGI